MTVVAVVAAALATWLLVPARPRTAASRADLPGLAVPILVAAVVGAVVVGSPRTAALLVVGAGTVVAGAALWRRRARRRVADTVAARVLETCDLLAAELASGQPPGRALQRASRAWPPLAPAADAFALGGDVPSALRELARQPGARDLRLVAAAWAVAHRTGQGLADAVERVAGTIRGAHATGRVVEGELASARATARLVAGLPVLALLMGSGAGGDSWGFLFGHPIGLACLAGGLLFGFAGLWWIEALSADVAGHR